MDKMTMVEYLQQHHSEDLHKDYVNYVLSFDSFELQHIPLSSICTTLCDLDSSKVCEYAQMKEDSAPPIVVGDGYIIDGYHRANAALQRNKQGIDAWVGVYG